MADDVQALRDEVARLARRVGELEDIQAVRTLHFKYGYYMDACLYEEVIDLFAEDAELKFLNGVYVGKAGVRRLYRDWLSQLWTKGRDGIPRGLLYDHLQVQDVVDIAPDGQTAHGRFRALMLGGWHDSMDDPPKVPQEIWEGGIYENAYRKEGGVWKFWRFDYNMLWQAEYQKGWGHSEVHLMPLTRTWPEDPRGPDRLVPTTPKSWPDTRVVPFHYPHPVTGKPWRDDE